MVSQVVNALSTTSVLTSSPNPSSYGSSVTFTDTVSASSGTPTGTVTFYSCTTSACSTKTSLGTGTLNSSGKATYSTSSLPVGTTYVEAIYGASGNYGGSTSNVVTQVVIGVPSVCASGGYGDAHHRQPRRPLPDGTNGNDFIYAFGASYWINGFGGNDCIDAGDGNNVIFDGNGNDGVSAGNGSNTVILGNGNDKVSLGNGSEGVETGDGNDTVTVGNGSQSEIIVGNGNDTVTVGTGSYNEVSLGSGTDTVTIQSPGSHDTIDGGNGNETIYLGSGTYNTYSGQAHHTNTCHLPKPPSSLPRDGWRPTTTTPSPTARWCRHETHPEPEQTSTSRRRPCRRRRPCVVGGARGRTSRLPALERVRPVSAHCLIRQTSQEPPPAQRWLCRGRGSPTPAPVSSAITSPGRLIRPGSTVNACGSSPTSLLPATPTSCNDTFVPLGNFTYTVTAVYNSWSSTSAASSEVTVVGNAPSASAPGVSATVNYGTSPYWVNNENVNLTDSPSTNGGSAITSVAYYYCSTSDAPCTSANWTSIGSTSAGGSWSVSWASSIPSSNWPADGTYDVLAVATDASSLTSATSSATEVGIDTTAPANSTPSVNGYQ